MGLFSFFTNSWRKGKRLRQISIILGAPVSMDVSTLLLQSDQRRAAEAQLFDLVESDSTLSALMNKYGASRADIVEIYQRLCSLGAGRWARGHWIPASALCYGQTLGFLLERTRQQGEPRQVWFDATYRIVDYFERGKVALVK